MSIRPPAATDHVALAEQYAREVVAGRILACVPVRQACARHLADREREKSDPSWPYRFDTERAARPCRFIEALPHVKGEWAVHPEAKLVRRIREMARAGASPESIAEVIPLPGWAIREAVAGRTPGRIRLEPWQCFAVCSIFGWSRRSTGYRRFRKASIYVPRKNAKSTLAAGIGWWMFAKDGEPGAEVYSGATSEKQAWEVFGPARVMGITVPALPDGLGVTVNASNMVREKDNCKFEPVIGKPGDGASPHCAIVDEYHEHPTSVLYDTMLTGMGARRQPLLLIISTAGDNVAGPCRDDWKLVESILAGRVADESHFGIIYTIDPSDAWDSETALRKANPNFDVSVSREFLMERLADAVREARKQGIFKIKHLNVWVSARNAYFNVERWRSLKNPNLKISDFAGQPCVAAADLASKVDLLAVLTFFPVDGGKAAVFGKYWIPSAQAELPENQHYAKWAAERRLEVEQGDRNDYRKPRQHIVDLSKAHDLREAAFDPDGADKMIAELQEANIECIEVPQTMEQLSDPMKELDAMIRAGQLEHDGDPVLEWAIGNVVTKMNHLEQVYPRKESDEKKIDPAVALIMCVKRRERAAGGTGAAGSVYDTRDVQAF